MFERAAPLQVLDAEMRLEFHGLLRNLKRAGYYYGHGRLRTRKLYPFMLPQSIKEVRILKTTVSRDTYFPSGPQASLEHFTLAHCNVDGVGLVKVAEIFSQARKLSWISRRRPYTVSQPQCLPELFKSCYPLLEASSSCPANNVSDPSDEYGLNRVALGV